MPRKKKKVKYSLFCPLAPTHNIIQFTALKLLLTYRGANKFRMNL